MLGNGKREGRVPAAGKWAAEKRHCPDDAQHAAEGRRIPQASPAQRTNGGPAECIAEYGTDGQVLSEYELGVPGEKFFKSLPYELCCFGSTAGQAENSKRQPTRLFQM